MLNTQNMANAEEDLYRVWKDLTLNSSVGDQSKYRLITINHLFAFLCVNLMMKTRHHQECFNKKYHSLRCRVWDYPIKEQYTSIYKVLVINNNKKHFQIQPEGKLGIMLLCNDGFDHHRGPGDQQDGHGGHL